MKRFTILILIGLLAMPSFAQKGFRNPAAAYCERLGYQYNIESDRAGNDVGVCILPNGNKVNAWDFYRGKVATEYSYAAIKGFEMTTEVVTINGFTMEQPVCTRMERGQQIKLTLEQLMEQNGDKLDLESRHSSTDPMESAKVDPNFKVSRAIPTSFDWRSNNGHSYIGGVRDQGSCGSCYAFGATACAEGTYNVATSSFDSNTADFAESYIAWCLSTLPAYSSHFSGCNGADYDYMELQALVDVGTVNESYFPYTTTATQSCPAATSSAPKTKFASWSRVPCLDAAAIKTAIMTYGVVDAAVYVSTSFQNYTGGVYTDTYTSCSGSPCYNTTTNHAIALVGWGTDATYGDYWILRNSWGNSWGESGYMRLAVSAARVGCSVCYMTYINDGTTAPTVTSNDVTAIADNSATSGGNITSNGGTAVTESGIVYAKTTDPTTSTGTVVATSPVTTTGSFSLNMTGLASGTTYYVRAYATNAKGTSYGASKQFITTGTPALVYCTSQGNSCTDEWIANVAIGSFTNASAAASYTDFTAKTVNLAAGVSNNITLTPGFSGTAYSEYWKIWVDLNKDGDFDDTGELIFNAGALSKVAVTGTLTIPAGTAAVTTRMRVSMKYNAAQTQCEAFSYGEVEDYTAVITSGGGANVAPVAEANGPYSAVVNTNITFSSTGSTDSDGTIASYAWNFGDGSTSTLAAPTHAYTTAGTYTATLTVTDNGGLTATDQATVTITPASNGDVQLLFTDFESGLGLWTDGGVDCALYTSGTYAYAGNNAADIQDNTSTTGSFYLTNGIDVATPNYVQIKVSFNFYAVSMETGEDFWVQYYNGSTWATVKAFVRGTDFNNSAFYAATVTIDEANYTFPTNMKVRFMCDASDNNDDIYIDNIKITASTTRTSGDGNATVEELFDRRTISNDSPESLSVYPNPTNGSSMTVAGATSIKQMQIFDLSGKLVANITGENTAKQTINISKLSAGVYFIRVWNGENTETIKFIKE